MEPLFSSGVFFENLGRLKKIGISCFSSAKEAEEASLQILKDEVANEEATRYLELAEVAGV